MKARTSLTAAFFLFAAACSSPTDKSSTFEDSPPGTGSTTTTVSASRMASDAELTADIAGNQATEPPDRSAPQYREVLGGIDQDAFNGHAQGLAQSRRCGTGRGGCGRELDSHIPLAGGGNAKRSAPPLKDCRLQFRVTQPQQHMGGRE